MLVLTQRLGETVVIDGGIQVTVVAVQGDKVRLGITAPAATRVDRKEVHERRTEFDAGPAMVEVGVRLYAEKTSFGTPQCKANPTWRQPRLR